MEEINKKTEEFVNEWSNLHHESDGFYESAMQALEEIATLAAEKERKRILEALPKEQGSVCSAHQYPAPYCRMCGHVYGFNKCLEEIKQTLAKQQQ